MLRTTILILGLLLAKTASAQDFHLVKVASKKELGEGRYNTLFQDKHSVFWIGTSSGLVSFDGFEFNRINCPTSNCVVTAIYEDRNEVLWVGTENGEIMQVLDNILHVVPDVDSMLSTRIIGFSESAEGVLMAISYSDGICFVKDGLQKIEALSFDGDIYCHEIDITGRLWFGTDQGIQVCNFIDGVAECFIIDAQNGLMDEIVSSLARGSMDDIWIGTFDKGYGYVGMAGDKVISSDSEWVHGNVTAMVYSENGNLWLGTESEGLYIVDENNRVVEVNLPEESSGHISDLSSDAEGNLWILDAHDGLYRTGRHFRVFNTDIGDVQSVIESNAGDLIIGTDRGLFVYDLQGINPTYQELLNTPANIISLYNDEDNTIWAGTFGKGIIAIPAETGRPHVFNKYDGLTDESVLSIVGASGTIWLATLGGVTEIKHELINGRPILSNAINYNEADGLGTNFIYCAAMDRNNDIWFGTDGHGLSLLSNQSLTNFEKTDTVTLNSVYSLTVDRDNDIWFATDDNGLWMFDRSTFYPIIIDRLENDIEISSLITDDVNILIVTDETVTVWNKIDGLQRQYHADSGLEGFAPSLNAISKSDNGTIWIGGRNKILQYLPPRVNARNTPITQITDVKLFLNHLDSDRTELNHDENHLTFEFRGIWYSSPQDVRYRFRVDGLDPDWRYTNERVVSYQNIPPGEYEFVVQSSTSRAFSSESAVYKFEVRPAFYTRLWFILLVILIVALAVRQLIVTRERRLRKNEELQRRQVESQFQALKAQINPHFLFNILNTLVSAIEEDPDTAVLYVEKLSDFYRSILQYRDRTTISLEDEIQLTTDYAFLLQMRFDDKLKIEIDKPSGEFRIMPLTVQMLVENAVKHNVISSATPLLVKIYMEDEYLVVYNKANRKNSSGTSTKFGLKSIIERYEVLSSRPVIVDQTPDHFIVKIPLLKNNEVSNYRR